MRNRLIVAAAAAGMLAVLPAAAAAAGATPTPTASGAQSSVVVVAAGSEEIPQAAETAVAAMTLQQKAASVVMATLPTTDTQRLRDYMLSTGIGGFILMGSNIPFSESALRRVTTALTLDAALPPLIAVDEEGGDVTRLPWDRFPGADVLKHDPPSAAQDAFLGRGALLQRVGIGVNFGIVADVTDNRSAFIYRRVLGTTPAASADRVAAALAGEGGQALSTLKHFPGHGAAAGNSHVMIPTTSLSEKAWRESDAVPFETGFAAGAPLLMFGHLRFTAVDEAPASLSAPWHEIARDLGFQGVAITDDLGMLQASGIRAYRDPVANAVAALRAGNDMVLAIMYTDPGSAARLTAGIVAAVEDGTLPQARLDEAATRVTALRLQIAAAGRGLVPCGDCAPVE